jgi:hypothetical protein
MKPEPVPRISTGWLVSPTFDLVFLANIGWLAVLLPGFLAADGKPYTEFWQIYFLTTPHRWLTLILVTLDSDRRVGRDLLFIGLALVAAAVVLGARLTSGTFLCLALIDTLWNGWHFAAQHYGVLRLYSRQSGSASWLEWWLVRPFVFYITLRVAAHTLRWFHDMPTILDGIRLFDGLMLLIPIALLGREVGNRAWQRPGKLAYLLSFCLLFSGLLIAVRLDASRWVLALASASATFHAVEYLALVTFYAWRRTESGSPGLFRRMASRWLGLLALYIVALGLMAVAAQSYLRETWVGLNLWAAFLHYAYDGLIWKLRRPETARILGATS